MSLFLTEKINSEIININCQNSNNLIDPNSIMVEIEGLHAIATGNYTRYMPASLEKSVPSWTHPYCKPVIMHHNEEDGTIIGRIHSVEYKTMHTRSNTPALSFTINVPDEEGKRQIQDGRLSTVSVGINATDVRCSVCGHNVAKHGKCEHKRGHIYNGDICYWDIYEFLGKELSYVITPSDPFAHNIKIYSPTASTKEKSKMIINESISPSTEVIEEPVTEVREDSDGESVVTQIAENVDTQTQPIDTETPAETQPTTDNVVTADTSNAETNTVDAGTPAVDDNAPAVQPEQPTETDPAVASSEQIQESQEVRESCPCGCNSSESVDINNVIRLTREIAQLSAEIRDLNNSRYTLENQLYDTMLKYKQLLAEKLNSLRIKLGKNPVDVETLVKRSDVSLEDAITDCATELAVALQESETAIQDGEVPEEESTTNITEGLKPVDSPISIHDDTLEDSEPQTTNATAINMKETFNGLDKVLFGR